MFDRETIDFLHSGCALVIGTVSPDGEPRASRGWAITVIDPAADRVRLVLDALDAVAQQNLATNGRIAVTGGNVRTMASTQLKGRAGAAEPATEEDRRRVASYCRQFFRDVHEMDGTELALLDRLIPADFVACEVAIEESFDQTPGPGAGSARSSGES